jgi:AAA+ superfamily predicted ATPase
MQIVSSAIIDKYIGESARLIREMFNYAREHQVRLIMLCFYVYLISIFLNKLLKSEQCKE